MTDARRSLSCNTIGEIGKVLTFSRIANQFEIESALWLSQRHADWFASVRVSTNASVVETFSPPN